jgi:hypothetical protein
VTDFADYPVSLSERRATKASDCRLWTPRDALVSMLRDIDDGKISPDALICVCREHMPNDEIRTHFVNAAPDLHTALGLLTRGQFKLMEE